MNPRIGPGGLRQTGPAIWAFSRIAGRVTGTTPPNVFTTLGRGRGLFWGWLHFAGCLMPGGKLARRETELVILRVAHLRGCDYELDHHTRLGRRVGVSDEDLVAVLQHPQTLPAREALLLAAAEELLERRDLTDKTWSLLKAWLSDREIIELLLLVGHYDMLATTLMTLRVQPDRSRRSG